MNDGDGFAPIAWWSPEMVRQVERQAHRFCRHWAFEHEDLCQEAYCWIAYWIRTRGDAPVSRRLLSTIARNGFQRYVRRLKRLHLRIPLQRVPEWRLFEKGLPIDVRLDVREAMAALTPRQRDAIRGRYFEFRSLAELAEAWGVKGGQGGSVAQINGRAYAKMRPALAGGYGPAADRKCTANRYRKREMTGRSMNWSKWGPIPNQREED